MLAKLYSIAPVGLDAEKIDVEVFVSGGLAKFIVVGLGDTAVQEARERVRSAIKNSGGDFPSARVAANLAPADLKKEGPSFDFPLALAVLSAFGRQITLDSLGDAVCVGELAFTGELCHTPGILPLAANAKRLGFKRIFVPTVNATEAALIHGIEVYGVSHLKDMIQFLRKKLKMVPVSPSTNSTEVIPSAYTDMADIRGQIFAKRALEVSAAGGHNVLMCGAPGSGKTLMARALPGILPPLSFDESLTVTKIHSLARLIRPETPLVHERPFRSVHHTASAVSIVGGGKIPGPGEISLAHLGVLFFDEIGEFPRHVLEVLRQPLEDKIITISRAQATLTFPADCTLVAAMNPCPCGYFQVADSRKPCTCSPHTIERYQKKLSGPLLDRFDLFCGVSPVSYTDLDSQSPAESSELIRKRVVNAREIQRERFAKESVFLNCNLSSHGIKKYCHLDADCRKLMETAANTLHLSARSYFRVIKVSRTLADIDGRDEIKACHVAEALQYRQRNARPM
jgi:magnesium chelatase family protein